MIKYLLILLTAIVVYVFYTQDLIKQVDSLKDNLLLINTKLYQNQQILKNKEKFIKEIEKQKKIAIENEKKLFSPETNNSIVLGQIQSFITGVANSTGVEVVSSNWGEPIEKEGYIKLPVSFIVRLYPQQITEFFNRVYSFGKLLKIETLTIGKFRKEKLVLTFTVSGFKLLKGKEL